MMKTYQQYKDEAFTYSVDWGIVADKLGTTVSTVAWSVKSGSASISGDSVTSGLASALISTSTVGCALIQAKATLADSTVDIHYFKINVSDPVCIGYGGDY